MGARRLGELFDRYGRESIETAFDAILDTTTETYRREILSKIPDGTYVWEDYAEHDGVDEPQLHTQRITLTKVSDAPADPENGRPAGPRLIIDFTGTSKQARGPINHCGDYVGGNFLKKWLAPILRNLADTPERMAELDVNEGIVPLIEMRFPEKGTLLTPIHPGPTNARTFVILRLLGVLAGVVAKAVDGKMPADQETIRYTGVYGKDLDGNDYLMREVLGGGSGGRYYADGEDTIHVVPDSRNLPTEFTESRFPFIVERLGLAQDSGGAGEYRGGLGYEKQIRMLKDAHFMSIADRSILACWGVRGGKAGMPFQVVIDPGGPDEREVDALADAEEIKAGQVVRIRTTGGGGWGDPLARDPQSVVRDVVWRKVSAEAALRDYGVVLTGLGRRGRPRLRRGRDGHRALRSGGVEPRGRRLLRPRSGLRLARRRCDARGRRPDLTVCARRGGRWPRQDRAGRLRCARRPRRRRRPAGTCRLAGPRVGRRRVRGGVRHRAEPAPRRAGVRRLGARRADDRRGGAGRLPLGRLALRPRDAAPPRQGRERGPRPPQRPGLDDPPAGRLPPEPRPHRAGSTCRTRPTCRSASSTSRTSGGRRRRADRARPRRCDVRARVPRRDGPGAGRRGRCRGATGAGPGHPPLAVGDVRLLRRPRPAGGHAGAGDPPSLPTHTEGKRMPCPTSGSGEPGAIIGA